MKKRNLFRDGNFKFVPVCEKASDYSDGYVERYGFFFSATDQLHLRLQCFLL
jgi:hypothetical protein